MATGELAEMATGEGKTLAAVAPTLLGALRGRGALVVTTNDYLARRDADSVGLVLRFLGLSVGLVEGTMDPGSDERRDGYAADVTRVRRAGTFQRRIEATPRLRYSVEMESAAALPRRSSEGTTSGRGRACSGEQIVSVDSAAAATWIFL